MGALAEVVQGIRTVRLTAPNHRQRYKVVVGRSTELAIRCETSDHALPIMIEGRVEQRRAGSWPIIRCTMICSRGRR